MNQYNNLNNSNSNNVVDYNNNNIVDYHNSNNVVDYSNNNSNVVDYSNNNSNNVVDYSNNNSNIVDYSNSNNVVGSQWTFIEDKIFEECLVLILDGIHNGWEYIAEKIPGKSVEEIKHHFEVLVHDVYEIDAGRVQVPDYCDNPTMLSSRLNSNSQMPSTSRLKQQVENNDRKKGSPWTETEHKLFLIGLNRYGRGDWRSISRNIVITRTPTQVASHAQKYFLRQASVKKERKRSSIHDITTETFNAQTIDVLVEQNRIPQPVGVVQQARRPRQLHPRPIDSVGKYRYPMFEQGHGSENRT